MRRNDLGLRAHAVPRAAVALAFLASSRHNTIFAKTSSGPERGDRGMDSRRHFLRGVLVLSAASFVFFTLEFLVEWNRLGRPDVTFVGKNDNVKMVDVLSPM